MGSQQVAQYDIGNPNLRARVVKGGLKGGTSLPTPIYAVHIILVDGLVLLAARGPFY